MSHRCDSCGNVCHSTRKVSDWELAEIRKQARAVMEEHQRQGWTGNRQQRLRQVAEDYGINIRTLYRYLERAA